MISLTSPSQKLQAVLAGSVSANQCQIYVRFKDVPAQTKSTFEDYKGAVQVATSNNTTDVDICAAPSALNNTCRDIDHISIYNADTGNVTVTVKLDDSGTETILVKQQLLTTESLVYEHGSGWQIL
jgi:hypothetical protein